MSTQHLIRPTQSHSIAQGSPAVCSFRRTVSTSHQLKPYRHCQLHQSVCMNGKSTCCEEEARLVRDLVKNGLQITGLWSKSLVHAACASSKKAVNS